MSLAPNTATPPANDTDDTPEVQGPQQGPAVSVRVDDSDTARSYVNAFRTSLSTEEVVLDLGLNRVAPGKSRGGQDVNQIIFEVDHRAVLNYYTAKRLAVALSQIVRHHEQRFGELKLNAAERQVNNGAN